MAGYTPKRKRMLTGAGCHFFPAGKGDHEIRFSAISERKFVIDVLTDLFILRGLPTWIRSDNRPEFVAEAVRRRIAALGARTAFIEPGSPWENGCIESFNAWLRDELLNAESFYTLKEAQVLIESWRRHYNAVRPHGSLQYRPPAPETSIMPCWPPGSATLRRPPSFAGKPAMH